eukprot:scpid68106/ scgid22204/ 
MEARQDVRKNNIRQLREHRSHLETFLGSQSQSIDILDAILQRDSKEKCCLTAETTSLSALEALRKDSSSLYKLQETVNSDEEVNLQSAVQVCQAAATSLQDNIENFQRNGLLDAGGAVTNSHLSSQLDLQSQQLTSLKSLRLYLQEQYIPRLESDRAAAKQQVAHPAKTSATPSQARFPGQQLGLLSASPSLRIAPARSKGTDGLPHAAVMKHSFAAISPLGSAAAATANRTSTSRGRDSSGAASLKQGHLADRMQVWREQDQEQRHSHPKLQQQQQQ